MNEYLEFAKDIAYKAGEIMRKYFKEENYSTYKSDDTIVTKADTEINHYLIKKVKEIFPTHSVIGEEEKYGESEYQWICDPVDGTAMYARHIPVAVFSLALAINGVPILGVIYDPFTDILYHAVKGKGSYKNDKKIHVSDMDINDIKSVANYDIWGKAEYDITDIIKELNQKSYLVSIGSVIRASMCVASGDFTFALFPGTKGKCHDIAAVKIIVEEAGGKVTDLFGNEQRYNKDINGAIISNKIVYKELVKITNKYLNNKKL